MIGALLGMNYSSRRDTSTPSCFTIGTWGSLRLDATTAVLVVDVHTHLARPWRL